MGEPLAKVAKDIGRGFIGAVNLGMPLLYTMETWWLGWRLPTMVIVLFALLGIVAIMVVMSAIGFRQEEKGHRVRFRRLAADFAELVVASFFAAYLTLILFGIIEWGDPLHIVVRLGLVELVPLGLGAAIANRALSGADEEEGERTAFGREMATFALGAAFFAFPVAPTEEMELMPAHAGWWRLVALALTALVLTYLMLYQLEFRGQRGRVAGAQRLWVQLGETVTGYVVALAVSAALLAGYGQFLDVGLAEMVQKTVSLGFLAALGGAAARVVV